MLKTAITPKQILRVLLLFLSLMTSSNNYGIASEKTCYEQNKLIENFDSIYQNSYNEFWDAIRCYEKKAATCKKLADTSLFIYLTTTLTGNAEFNEYTSEKLETLLINRGSCFFDALLLLDDKSVCLVIEKLSTPLFYKKKEIDSAIVKLTKDSKYIKIAKAYHSINTPPKEQ